MMKSLVLYNFGNNGTFSLKNAKKLFQLYVYSPIIHIFVVQFRKGL
jgi:hypothetical protein